MDLVHKDGEHYQEARKYFEHIIAHAKASDKDKALAFHNIGVTYNQEGITDSTRYFFDQALAIERTFDKPSILYITLHDLAEWHLHHGDIKEAEKYALKAADLYPKLLEESDSYNIFFLLQKIHTRLDQCQVASEYTIKYYEEGFELEKVNFQMDSLLASFKLESIVNSAEHRASKYQKLAIMTGVIALLVWIGWKIWFYWWRRDLWAKTHDLLMDVKQDESTSRYMPFGWLRNRMK